jgi:hypothetical protein
VVWVGEPWHGLGRSLAFGIDGPVDLAALPAAEDLAFHERAGAEYLEVERRTLALLAAGRIDQARPLAERLVALNPGFFNAHLLLARATADATGRRQHLERALALQPAYPEDEQAIRALWQDGEPGSR